MGILDYFDKEKRATKKVETNAKKLTNPYRQSEERMQCAGELAEDGRPEAIYGLLRRFTIKASNHPLHPLSCGSLEKTPAGWRETGWGRSTGGVGQHL